ncbi:MAG: hypothetical protein ACRDSS_13740, partial [Actinocrinis sp.]
AQAAGAWSQPILFEDHELEQLRERDQVVVQAEGGSDEAAALPGGWVIDTPGVRSFGLAHVSPDRVIEAFPDLAAVIAECPRGCTHASNAPDCGLDEWLASLPEGSAERAGAEARVDSVRRLLTALTEHPGDRN